MPERSHTKSFPGSGSGRTPALRQLISTLRSPGSEVWLADPAEHHHDLADHLDRHGAGIPGAIGLLEAADALIRQRQEAGLAQNESVPEPLVRVLVDDLPAILDQPQVAEVLLRILRTGRKAGVLENVLAEPGTDSFPGHPGLRAAFTRPRTR
ncbi:hypothetical protein [Streptacidiphilus neutrinimicus]|uniref:hypothetical protein n=1 Tax=Streptacidiphilus neutrinimicus TaxID=105420 RepID=UPI0005A64F68|nr:hypothetical protein [Streptacidiphilus neutrinimicus]